MDKQHEQSEQSAQSSARRHDRTCATRCSCRMPHPCPPDPTVVHSCPPSRTTFRTKSNPNWVEHESGPSKNMPALDRILPAFHQQQYTRRRTERANECARRAHNPAGATGRDVLSNGAFSRTYYRSDWTSSSAHAFRSPGRRSCRRGGRTRCTPRGSGPCSCWDSSRGSGCPPCCRPGRGRGSACCRDRARARARRS